MMQCVCVLGEGPEIQVSDLFGMHWSCDVDEVT